MTRTLEVLLIESEAAAGDASAAALEASGHHVHRCYTAVDAASPGNEHLCTAVTSGSCPLDKGVDVALVTRPISMRRPQWREGGVACAFRASVPVVEESAQAGGPFEARLAGRADGDVVAACEAAATRDLAALSRLVIDRLETMLRRADVDPDTVTCELQPAWPDLRVRLSGPPLPNATRSALGVKAVDTLRLAGRTFGLIDVAYSERPGLTCFAPS